MRFTVTWWGVLQAVTLMAFLLGAVSANVAILFSKERDQLCVAATGEKLMDKFLVGVSYFSLAFNIIGFLLGLVGVAAKSVRVKAVTWVLKDLLIGLLITAAVVTLFSALDLREEQKCRFGAKGKGLLALGSLALLLGTLYMVLRILMVLARPLS
jgi:hypothetical protein